jgi:hypothetical protein
LDNLQWTNGFVLSLMASANGASVNGEDDAWDAKPELFELTSPEIGPYSLHWIHFTFHR